VSAADRTWRHAPSWASGTSDNPMSDAAIEAKLIANATPAIGAERARRVGERIWSLEKCAEVRELIARAA
jgi:hypothetical protein